MKVAQYLENIRIHVRAALWEGSVAVCVLQRKSIGAECGKKA